MQAYIDKGTKKESPHGSGVERITSIPPSFIKLDIWANDKVISSILIVGIIYSRILFLLHILECFWFFLGPLRCCQFITLLIL